LTSARRRTAAAKSCAPPSHRARPRAVRRAASIPSDTSSRAAALLSLRPAASSAASVGDASSQTYDRAGVGKPCRYCHPSNMAELMSQRGLRHSYFGP
jgi:hypothetical protein